MSTATVPAVSSAKQPTPQEMAVLLAKIQELEGKLAAKNNGGADVTFIISEDTGAIILQNVGRFPTTWYRSQAERAVLAITGKPLDSSTPLGKFIADNAKLLSDKGDSDQVAADKLAMRKAAPRSVCRAAKNNTQK